MNPFCNQQFEAFIAVKQAGLMGERRRQVESYRSIDARIDDYSNCDTSRELFMESLRAAVVPLYQIALNQGYEQ